MRRLSGAVTAGAALLSLLSGGAVYAQASPPELFTPIANRIADATPDQNSRLQRLRSRTTTQSVSLIQITLNALKGNQLRIAIPGAAIIDLSKSGGDLRGDQDFTWSGAAAEQKANATVVVRNGEVTGSITDPAGLCRIEPVGNAVYALVKVDTAKLPPEEPPSFRQKERQKGALVPLKLDLNLADTATTQVDVLVAYTPAAKAAVSNIDSTIALAVAEANSFAHELGHLMGARHNEQADSTTTPFPYGHGYQHLAAPSWRTVMAYACASPCTRLQYWSNPDVPYGGATMGTAATKTSTYNAAKKWFEITIAGENYFYMAATTVATPSFATGGRGMCTSGSVSNKLLIECYDGAGNRVLPVSVGFATFKQPSQTGTYQGPLVYGVVAKNGAKQSGSANWTSTFNATDKQFEIAITGENYHYVAFATVVTPSFATGAEGFCTSSIVNSKLLVKCYDCSGNVVAPVSFSFASLKGAGAYQKPLAFGVVSTAGKKESGTSNFTSKYDAAAKQYAITITGQNYFYGSYATVVTPSFSTGIKGFCTTGSVSNNLLVKCYNSGGSPITPVSFGFATFK